LVEVLLATDVMKPQTPSVDDLQLKLADKGFSGA
jgi:hypothetical protein